MSGHIDERTDNPFKTKMRRSQKQLYYQLFSKFEQYTNKICETDIRYLKFVHNKSISKIIYMY